MDQVEAFGGAQGGHDVFVELLGGGEEFDFGGEGALPQGGYVKLVVGDIPLARLAVEGMGRGAEAEVMLALPVGGIVAAAHAR